jgi:type VI secretion system protein ImpH
LDPEASSGSPADPLGPGAGPRDEPDEAGLGPREPSEFDEDRPRGWPPGFGSLEDRLYDAPWEFDFYQAVRLLQWLRPDHEPVGRDASPRDEVVWFRAHQALGFPPSSLIHINRADQAGPPRLWENFLGLTGPSGVLPLHYTELLLDQHDRPFEESSSIRAFFDLFNHRLVSLFYRAWEKYRLIPPFERLEFLDRLEPDPYTVALLSLIGLGLPALRHRLEVREGASGGGSAGPRAGIDDLSLIHFGGLISNRKPNASSLEVLIRAYFRVEAAVIPFVGQWLAIEPSQQTRLPASGQNNVLGGPSSIGARTYDLQSKFRVRLGPLTYEQFLRFLPEPPPGSPQQGLALLFRLVRFYAGMELDCDVELVLRASEVPQGRLAGRDGPGSRLGWNSWVIGRTPGLGAADAVFTSSNVYNPSAQPFGKSD